MSVAILLLVLASRALHLAHAAVPVSFSSYPAYLEQRDCAKLCLWHVSALDDLIAAIGCSPPWVNECFCLPELARSAADFLSGCVASRCTSPRTAQVVTGAVSAYNNYCSSNGFSIPTLASIQSYSAYVSQPNCIQQCLWNSAHLSSDDLMPAIGCDAPWDNSCLCNTALVSTAGAFLSTCIASKCSTSVDAPQVTSALNVYGAYCAAAGLPLAIATVPAQTTGESTMSRVTGSTMAGPTGVISTPTPYASPAVEGADDKGPALTRGGLVGIAVGGVAGAAVLASIATCMFMRRRRRLKASKVPPSSSEVPFPPPGMYEKPTDPVAVEADWGTPKRLHEMPS